MSLFDKLPKILPFASTTTKQEYFFGLNIGAKNLEACVWGIEDNKLTIVNLAKLKYEQDNLIEKANLSLDEALADFAPEPEKILFGVPDSWLQDDNLKEDYLKSLRNLVKEIDISPMAYVSTSHAISHLLQKQQGVPLTAVLVGLSDPLDVVVVKAGKVVASRTVKRVGSLPEDIEKGLLSFSEVEVLPSKILVYGELAKDENSEKLKDELHSFSWMQNLPFLHLPKIEILNSSIAIAAVAFAGASEINPEVTLTEQSLEALDKNFDDTLISPTHSADELAQQEQTVDKFPETDEEESFKKAGFISGDIENIKVPENLEEEELPPEIDQRTLIRQEAEDDLLFDEPYQTKDKDLIPSTFNKIISPVSSLFGVPKAGVKKRLPLPSKFILLSLVVILFLAGAYVLLPKAKVTIFIDPKVLEKDAQVTVDPTIKQVDEANKKIPGSIVSTIVTGTEKGTASGKKQIGDPSKGGIVIYNKSSAQKSLSQGTVLIGPDNLTFSLDSSVNIASSSAVEGGITFGKVAATITATSIGPEGNLAAGKELTIKGQSSSDLSAKVDSAFSGGTSKEVTVVTADDQKKLLALASSNLRKKAKDELQAKLTGDAKILEEGLSENNVKATYSKKVNDQASDFTINLSINFKGTSYLDSDLKTMIAKLVQTNIPDNYLLNLADAETQADVAKIEPDGRLIFLAKFKAKLIPKLDQDQIKNQIKGKTPAQAAAILKNIENVISSEIKIYPSLPGPIQRIPILAKNISIEVTAK